MTTKATTEILSQAIAALSMFQPNENKMSDSALGRGWLHEEG